MKTKTIKVTNAQGDPLQGAHVLFEGNGTTTDKNGNATVTVSDPMSFVEISHVSGESLVLPFFDLPTYVVLGSNSLPPVIVTAEKKNMSWVWWAIAGVAITTIIVTSQNKPKKITI